MNKQLVITAFQNCNVVKMLMSKENILGLLTGQSFTLLLCNISWVMNRHSCKSEQTM